MASVSADDVRDVINISSTDISDAKLLKMIQRAEVTLELELKKEIDYSDCTDAEKEAITILAAIYALCYLAGGSAIGLAFSLGDFKTEALSNVPPLEVLQAEFERLLEGLRPKHLRGV